MDGSPLIGPEAGRRLLASSRRRSAATLKRRCPSSRSRKRGRPPKSFGRISAVTAIDTTLGRLRLIRIVAIVDFVLLVPLVAAALTHAEGVVDVLGPIHGVGFLLLLFLCVRGVHEDRWGWWFPVLVAVTLGPPGSLIGERRIRRGLESG